MRAETATSSSGTEAAEQAVEQALTAAEAVLAQRYGAAIELAEPEDLGGSERSTVLRARVARNPFSLPRTLVIKHYGPRAGATAAESFAREAVSYQLFTALAEDDRMCPELLAHDAEERLLVLEDLGDVTTLAERLFGQDGTAAERALLTHARSLGRLHATTTGREADFDALLRRIGTSCGEDPVAAETTAALRHLPQLLVERLGVRDRTADAKVADHLTWLLEGPKHRAFTPADLCPDNNLITDKGVRFLDFEGGRIREVLLDVACLRVPFPSCSCAFGLPRGMREAMLAAWSAEVSGIWPEFTDDEVLQPQLLDAQLFWVYLSTWWFLPRADEPNSRIDPDRPSPSRAAVVCSRWRQLAEDAEATGQGWLCGYASAVADAVAGRYPEGCSLPLYPAFG